MIRETTGDILTADVEALVNPVNTVGVMGAGLAAQFKHAYPAMYREYKETCVLGGFHVGQVMVHDVGGWPRYVVSFPTKQHWSQQSKLAWIRDGLIDLADVIQELRIGSIAIPPLGCGLGGLNWVDVRKLLFDQLGDLTDVDVALYTPKVGDQ